MSEENEVPASAVSVPVFAEDVDYADILNETFDTIVGETVLTDDLKTSLKVAITSAFDEIDEDDKDDVCAEELVELVFIPADVDAALGRDLDASDGGTAPANDSSK